MRRAGFFIGKITNLPPEVDFKMRVQEIKSVLTKYGATDNPSDYRTVKAKEIFVDHYMAPLLEGKEIENGVKARVPAEKWSLRVLWEALVGPIDETLPINRFFEKNYREFSINSTMFPKATGNLILNKVIEGYNMPGFIGNQLVENMPSNLKSETIVGFTDLQGVKEVGEGEEYEESSIGEKFVTTDSMKKGRVISLTDETIRFDKTGQILRRAQQLGEKAGIDKELRILKAVTGVDTQVYKPNGTATTLYAHATHKNLNDQNALTDWTNIDNAIQYHAANVRDDRQGETADPILWMPNTILCGPDLVTTARRIVGATEIRAVSNTSNTTISSNPFSDYKVLSSTLWSALGLTTGDWYIGDFMRQFVWHEVYPIQTFAQGATSESAFDRDIVARFKVRYYGGPAAIDHRYVIKNTVS